MKKIILLAVLNLSFLGINSQVRYISNLNNFNTQIQFTGITVVKFFADWCIPCKSYAPVFEKFSEQNKEIVLDDKVVPVQYLSVDIDKSADISNKCNISSIPTTIFYKNGQKISTLYGSLNKNTLLNKVTQVAK